MDINEIIENKSWWLQEDLTYHMDNEWVLNKDKPQNYRNFTYWRQFLYRTPIVYFQIAIRKHVESKRRSAKSDYFRKSILSQQQVQNVKFHFQLKLGKNSENLGIIEQVLILILGLLERNTDTIKTLLNTKGRELRVPLILRVLIH